MNTLSQKCQYALRALYELACCRGEGPISATDIAERQHIPRRYLESIFKQLREAGLVESRRGVAGGYLLRLNPAELSVGQVIRLIEGPLSPVDCQSCGGSRTCPLGPDCAFAAMWQRGRDALTKVYDSTSFDDLLHRRVPELKDLGS